MDAIVLVDHKSHGRSVLGRVLSSTFCAVREA